MSGGSLHNLRLLGSDGASTTVARDVLSSLVPDRLQRTVDPELIFKSDLQVALKHVASVPMRVPNALWPLADTVQGGVAAADLLAADSCRKLAASIKSDGS